MKKMKKKTELINFLKSKGWHQWYNERYWVKKDLVDSDIDYTNYGFDLEEAVEIERLNKNGVKIKNVYGIPLLNIIEFLNNIGIRKSRKGEV